MKPQQLLACLCVLIGAKMILETCVAAAWGIWTSVWSITQQAATGPTLWVTLLSMIMTTLPGLLGVILVWFAPWCGGFMVRFAGVPEDVEWSMAMDAGQFLRATLTAMGIYFMATAVPGIVGAVIHAMNSSMASWEREPRWIAMNQAGALGIVGSAIQFACGFVLLRSAKRISWLIFRRA